MALSTNINDDASHDDVLAVGAKYNASLAAMELGFGIGYSQLVHDEEENDAVGVSLDANLDNGFRAILNWIDMGDGRDQDPFGEKYIGVGLGYEMDGWTFAANWGKYSEEQQNAAVREQSGYAAVANYDLGGGAEVQFGYSKASCDDTGGFIDAGHLDCPVPNVDGDRISLGVAMSF